MIKKFLPDIDKEYGSETSFRILLYKYHINHINIYEDTATEQDLGKLLKDTLQKGAQETTRRRLHQDTTHRRMQSSGYCYKVW
jgi:hypothetical protein